MGLFYHELYCEIKLICACFKFDVADEMDEDVSQSYLAFPTSIEAVPWHEPPGDKPY